MATMPEQQLDRLRQTLVAMRQLAEQGQAFPDADREFHQRLFENLHNKTLLTLADTFWLTFRKAAGQTQIDDHDPLRTYNDHAAIVDAVAARDVARARVLLEQHYTGIVDRLTRAREVHE